ncbi:MAG: transposase [Rhodobacteraceae bacterium]|nr:transposase [Paracoccaceae bacterium]
MDGLKGFPQDIEAAFPQRDPTPDLHRASLAPFHELCQLQGTQRHGRRGGRSCAPVEVEDHDPVAKYPAANWRRARTEGIPFLDDPPEGRKPIHTATAIEARTSKRRRAVRTRGHFPNGAAAAKSIYLAQTATSR